MLNIEMHFRIVGVLLLILAAMNLLAPKRFGWPAELQRLSLLTRQVFIVHCAFIFLIVTMMGVLSLFFAHVLADRTPLSAIVLAGLAIFWTTRLAVQFFVYSPKLWRGNRFNTVMHVVFSCTWAYFAAVYAGAFITIMR